MFQKPIFGRKSASGAVRKIADFIQTTDDPALGGLNDELKRLDLFQGGLGRKALHYVAVGEPACFPLDLETIVTKVGRSPYNSPYFEDYSAVNDVHGMSDIAIAKGEVKDPQVLSRFIAIRRIVRPLVSQSSWNRPDLPDEELPSRELLASISQGDGRLNSHSYDVQPKPDVVPTLSPREVLELVQSIGGNPVLYFQVCGLATDRIFSRRDAFKSEFTQLICEHPRAFAQAIGEQFNDEGITRLVKLAEELGVLSNPPIMAAVFGLLGKGNSKPVRESTISTLARLDATILPNALKLGLAEGELEMRYDLVQIAGQVAKPEVVEVLQEHLPNERSGKVKGAIDAILDTQAAATLEPTEPDQQLTIPLANGEVIELAAVDESLLAAPTDDERTAFRELIALVNARRAAVLGDGQIRNDHQIALHQPITDKEIESLLSMLQGETREANGRRHLYLMPDLHKVSITAEISDALAAFGPALRWRVLIWLGGVSRFKGLIQRDYFDGTIVSELFAKEVAEGLDWQAIAQLCERSSHPEDGDQRSLAGAMKAWIGPKQFSYSRWENALETFPAEAGKQIIARSLPVFDEALGLAAATQAYSLTHAYSMLAMLPAVPEQYVPKLVELGLTAKRDEREGAQSLLHNADGLDKRLEEALDDRRQDVRSHAATWLADLRADDSEKALRKRLKKEKAETVRAALIEALLRLGADLSDVIGPDALVKEAEKKGGKLALPDWLKPDMVPQVRFSDGNLAPRDLIEYWIGLAVKLKDPGNTGLFGIYLDQLLPEDAQTLSGLILQSWIDFDTHGPSLDEANAHAAAYVDSRFNSWSRYNRDITREQVFASLKREKLNEIPNTGTKTKGVLALACRAEPAFAAERVRWFLKKHGRRSHQAMALLDMLAGMNSPTAMQVVISAATRLKQKSTMAHANAIAERYAKDRGWSYDELADRTVPTAGFNDDGILELPCGLEEKPYSARIDEQLAVHISNPDGKSIKSLPAGDDDTTKESKKALSAAKRELKQIIAMQTQRLAEAMASERKWPVEDWLECFHAHPVMRRLVERLVWQALDEDGNPQTLLRATQEGDFTDADDHDIDVRQFGQLRLAHAALVDPATADAWRAHLKDYEIKPLIEQFPAKYAPFGGEKEEATGISDRHGWLGESRSYRSVAEKLGYQREMGDGGGCVGYYKSFSAADITAVIETYGGYAIDENVPQALKDLIFRKRGSYQGVALSEVPPVLLAMCHADLHVIAKKGAFDEDWQNKSEW